MDRFTALIGGEHNLPPISARAEPLEHEQKQTNGAAMHDLDGLPPPEVIISRNRVFEEEAWEWRKRRVQIANEANAAHHSIGPAMPQPLVNQPELDTTSMAHMGESAPRGFAFSPFVAVTKFCYKYVPKQYSQALASAFWDSNKIYERGWDLYYIHSAHELSGKPHTYVSQYQFQALLDEVNHAFPKADIKLGDDIREEGMVLDFDSLPDELRPRCLGRLQSREQYDTWMLEAPITPKSGKMPADRSLEAFRAMLEATAELGKAKSKAKKRASHQMVIQSRQDMGKQVLRAQRRLGLKKKNDVDDLERSMAKLDITAFDPTKLAPFPFEDDAIIIAVDVEAYERSARIITEVGIATLDTRDLHDTPPGAIGQDCGWNKHIRGRHFRVIEHKHLCNHEFVQGCPDRFEFGQSEFVSSADLASTLTSCFHEPFSKKAADGTLLPSTSGEDKRNLILLGHDIGQDVQFLHSIGFSVLNRGNLTDTFDTAAMFKSLTKDVNPTSLGRILSNFDMMGWHLHNAGNDAVYTLQAMLAICIKDAMSHDEEEAVSQREAVNQQRTNVAVDAALERRADEMEGWDLPDGEDGGVAIVPKEEDYESKKTKAARALHGPPRPPPVSARGLYTTGGAPLDV
ncbi:hypothetical protein LTR78_009868 [Recurvomyces mirabilis]|uniref:Gfd2/YDR514C-like C-terminal domain-containing protein n=1 Tax=Recurvomyces mirabilis TaxID=574656 RepID=A0AAE0TN21_9PEZI|nr:hypothetical protein LTR78_009868 [Recurvomyces mirabilis]KAK5150543.1 hypothetical protein LTS14_010037 [Recurvomyces mirabilis]